MTNLRDKIATLPAARRAKVAKRAKQLIAEELSLRDLRRAMNRTQVSMARKLRVGQDTISRVEKRTDMLLSTLRGYVEAMGGELDIVAKFPNRSPVRLADLGEIAPRDSRRAGRS